MARILVTGASGFIGRHAALRLHSLGHEVLATGRDPARLPPSVPGLQCERAELAADELAALVRGRDAVVHCAARSSPWGTAAGFQRDNVLATARLLQASAAAGVRRFVHLGSPSIYFRFADQLDVGEDFTPPARWITEYARSKWESELRVQAAAAQGLPALVLRPRAVFGPGDNAILPRLLAVAGRGWFPLVHGGRALIDITHVDNVVDAIVLALAAGAPADGRAFNISNGEPLQVRDLVGQLFSALGRDVRRVNVPRGLAVALAGLGEAVARRRPDCPEPRLTRYGVGVIGYSQTLDISRARRELGYAPRVRIADGIARFAREVAAG